MRLFFNDPHVISMTARGYARRREIVTLVASGGLTALALATGSLVLPDRPSDAAVSVADRPHSSTAGALGRDAPQPPVAPDAPDAPGAALDGTQPVPLASQPPPGRSARHTRLSLQDYRIEGLPRSPAVPRAGAALTPVPPVPAAIDTPGPQSPVPDSGGDPSGPGPIGDPGPVMTDGGDPSTDPSTDDSPCDWWTVLPTPCDDSCAEPC